MVVLGVYPHSSTVMIATSISDIMVGDHVELMDGPLLPPPPPPPPMNPPTISCQASPVSVRKGESSTVTCDVASPDNRQISLSFSSSSGRLTPRDNTALLDTGTADPGAVTVVATATDDRNLSSTAQASVNVAGAAGPPAATNNEVQFAKGSARVDNKAKAILDGVALLMQQQADSTAVVIGMPDSDSKAGAKLAIGTRREREEISHSQQGHRPQAHPGPRRHQDQRQGRGLGRACRRTHAVAGIDRKLERRMQMRRFFILLVLVTEDFGSKGFDLRAFSPGIRRQPRFETRVREELLRVPPMLRRHLWQQ